MSGVAFLLPSLPLRFSHIRSSIQAFLISIFFFVKTHLKITDITKVLIPMQIGFSNFGQSFVYIYEIYISSKKNSEVKRSSHVINEKNFLDICICYFLDWKYFTDILKNNSSLSKPTLK